MRTRIWHEICPVQRQRRCFRSIGLPGLMVLAVSVASAAEPDFVAEHQKRIDQNPPSVTMTIELVDAQTRFRVGELIPMDIVYRFKSGTDLLINDGFCGTVRLLEVFHVSPRVGTRSMTQDEPDFHSSAGGTPLDVKLHQTYRYRVYLNEWRRFDSPGRYQFYSESARIWASYVYPNYDNKVRVTSNVLELEIIPADTDWQADQIRQAIKVLEGDNESVGDDRAKVAVREQQRLTELRRLRYLDTETATRQLVRISTGREDQESHETAMGLLQSRFKSIAVDELERRLKSTDFTVTRRFLGELARLAADVQMPIDHSQFNRTAESIARKEQLRAKHYELEQSLLHKYTEEARQAADLKNPLIKAKSFLEQVPGRSVDFRRNSHPPTGEELTKIRNAIVAEFEHLAPVEQASVLGSKWKLLGGIEFLPVLRSFIATAPDQKNPSLPRSLVAMALDRVWQLAPQEGAALVLAELKRPKPRAELSTFKRVLTHPDPTLDELLIGRLENTSKDVDQHDQEVAAMMLAHLGGRECYDQVRRLFDDRDDDWGDIRSPLLAYLIRHNAVEGTRLINQEIDNHQSAHFSPILSEIAEAQMSIELEAIAIQRLDDPDPQVAQSAVLVLGSYGSAAAEPALWRRLEKWETTWKDRVAELQQDEVGNQPHPEVQFESMLVEVLSTGKSWFSDVNTLRRLRKLSVVESTQKEIDEMIDAWSGPIAIRLFPGTQSEFASAVSKSYGLPGPADGDNWTVAQYSSIPSLTGLKTLLARFPTGTTFAFPSDVLTDEDAEKALFADLEASLTSRRQKLVKTTQSGIHVHRLDDQPRKANGDK